MADQDDIRLARTAQYKCQQCGIIFTTRACGRLQKFCGLRCRLVANAVQEAARYRERIRATGREARRNGKRPLLVLECAHCGRTFETKDRRRKFCCVQCVSLSNRRFLGRANWNHGNAEKRARRYGVARCHVDRFSVFERDGWKCQVCGVRTPKRLNGKNHERAPELDHRVPMKLGGPHIYENVQLVCRKCNRKKGSRFIVGQMNLFPTPTPIKRSPTLRT